MLNQPMSSPIMTTILGFFSCACSGPPAPMSAAVPASSEKTWIKFRFIVFCLLVLVYLRDRKKRFRFIKAHGGRDEAAIRERCPDGRQEVGSEPRLNDKAKPARIECGLSEVGVFVDREEDQACRPLRAPELARRFDAVEPRHCDVEHDDIRTEPLRLSEECASIAH